MFGSSKQKQKPKVENTSNNQPSLPPKQQPPKVNQVNQNVQPKPSTQPNQPTTQTNRSQTMETLISASCKVEGNIQSEQSVKVEGQVEGNINVKETLVIAAKGQVAGDIVANTLIVYGHLQGDSQLKEIHIQDGGHIDGNIKTQSLKVDPNATYNGVVTMTKESLQPASALMNKKDKAENDNKSANTNNQSK